MWSLARTALASSLVLTAACSEAGAREDERPRTHAEREMPDASVPQEPPDAAAPVLQEPQLDACERRNPAITVSSEPSERVSAGTALKYTLSVRNQNVGGCAPEAFLSSVTTPPSDPGFHAEPESQTSPPLAAGEQLDVVTVVTSASDQEAGSYPLQFFLRSLLKDQSRVLTAEADTEYVVAEPVGCHVAVSRELLIRHPTVVDDSVRTLAGGAWTFGKLMQQASRSDESAADSVEAMFRSFASEQTVNGFKVEARRAVESIILDSWPRTEAGKLNLARSPLRLLAIVNRLDLADRARAKAGEGRFVYGIVDASGASLLFSLIVEYLMPAQTEADARDWAFAVHALQAAPFPSESYNAALQTLTERFAARGVAPKLPNGSALLRIRTNENALARDGRWEMREFHLSSETGLLTPAPLEQTPDVSFNGSSSLTRFIQANQASILTETHEVPAMLDDKPFEAGALINKLDYWKSTGISSEELRHKFSLNTCDGCHGGETATSFFHVFPRSAGSQSQLSTFLTGAVERDPSTGEARPYNELARRRQLLESIVCADD
jgi:hypothetical protein